MWSSFSCFLRQSFTKYVLDFSLAFGPLRKERRHRYKWGEEKKLLQTIDTVAGQVDSWRLVPRPANLVFCYLEPLFQFFELFAGDGAIGRLDAQLAGPNGRFTPPQFPLLLLLKTQVQVASDSTSIDVNSPAPVMLLLSQPDKANLVRLDSFISISDSIGKSNSSTRSSPGIDYNTR